ncbi:MAG: metallophosphoesterase [Rhodoferax sp.]
MKIALYSDIHLERQSFKPGPRAHAADVIVLAGDIGQGTQGLEWARNTFKDKPIVMVLGNHEFFGGNDFFQLVDEARRRARELDIALLECEEVSIGGVRFLGATLWTDLELLTSDPDDVARLKVEAQKSMKDYSSGEIRAQTQGDGHGLASGSLTPELTIQRHWQTRAWLEKTLADGAAERMAVVTHHCPSLHSIPPQFQTGDASKFSPMYASDLSYLGGQCALWLHGHVHASADYQMHETRVICNPKGYNSLELGPQNPHFTDLLIEL